MGFSKSVFRIRIRRIRTFLGLPDPDPLLFARIRILQSTLEVVEQTKIKNFIDYNGKNVPMMYSFYFLLLILFKNDENVLTEIRIFF